MNYKKALLIFQIFIHVIFLAGLFLFPIAKIFCFIVISQVIYVGFCGTVYFHRVVSHKNPIYPFIDKILLFVSWLGVSGSVIAWVGTHRKHHRYTDSERDPHSPTHMGRLRAYWYSSGDEDIVRYIPDLLRNPLYLLQHKHYFKVLLVIHFIGLIFLTPLWYWGLLVTPAFLMWFAGSSVNALCHDDHGPINNPFLGILHAGEGWHKNHHSHPNANSFRHWTDWGYYIHKLIKRP